MKSQSLLFFPSPLNPYRLSRGAEDKRKKVELSSLFLSYPPPSLSNSSKKQRGKGKRNKERERERFNCSPRHRLFTLTFQSLPRSEEGNKDKNAVLLSLLCGPQTHSKSSVSSYNKGEGVEAETYIANLFCV